MATKKLQLMGVKLVDENEYDNFESAVTAIRYTEQSLTEEQKAQARENIGASALVIIEDKQGNMLPIEQSAESVTANGVTIAYKDGVYTLNGTCTTSYSFEIVPKGTEYGTLVAGQEYKLGFNELGGTYTGESTARPSLFVAATGVTGNLITYNYKVSGTYISYIADKKYVLNRFAISVNAGAVFDNLQITPYLGTEFSDDYAGIAKVDQAEIFKIEIDGLSSEVKRLNDGTANVYLPSMYIDERNRVLDEVQETEADFRLAIFADPHSFAETKYKKYNDLLASGSIDVLLGLGDYNAYSNTFTKQKTIRMYTEMMRHSGRTPNCLYAIGNHDVAYIEANSGNVDQSKVLTKKELHDCFSRHLNGFAHFNVADPYGGYYYVDYDAAKIRLIVLNTSDIYEADGSLQYKYYTSCAMQQPQITWFANTALDLSEKSDRSEWSVLVCKHAYMDNTQDMVSSILSAVKAGTAINKSWSFPIRLVNGSTTVDSTNPVAITANKDFSTQGAVDVIGVLYGHGHKNISSVANGIPFIEFIADTAELDDFYVTSVENIATRTDNSLPIDQAQDSYAGAGITITHTEGVFTINGTSSIAKSFEIVPYTTANPTEYTSLKAGVTYTLGMNVLGGEASINSQAVYLFIKTKNADGTIKTYENKGNIVSFTPEEDCSVIRFALNIPAASYTYTNYVVEPYLFGNETSKGLPAGDYYITTVNGVKMGFTVSEDVINAAVIGYNNYHGQYGSSAPIRLQDANGQTIATRLSITAKTANYVDGMTEITGFERERTAGTVEEESWSVASIDKDTRSIKIVPYGTGIYREFSY